MEAFNSALAVRFLTAIGDYDAATAEACVDPEGFMVAKGTSNFAGARRFGGSTGEAVAAFAKIMPGGLNFKINAVTAEGDRVVVQADGDAVTHDGHAYKNTYCFVCTISGERIIQVEEYCCTKMADEILWPSLQSAFGMTGSSALQGDS